MLLQALAAAARSALLFRLLFSVWLLLVLAPWWGLVAAGKVLVASYAAAWQAVRGLWQGE